MGASLEPLDKPLMASDRNAWQGSKGQHGAAQITSESGYIGTCAGRQDRGAAAGAGRIAVQVPCN